MFRSSRRPLVVPQAVHARLAASIAAAWHDDDAFVRGVALHDRGYGELDTDEIGVMDDEQWLPIMRRGFAMRDGEPLTDLVACMHIRRLVGDQAWEGMDDTLAGLRGAAGLGEDEALELDAITNVCDRISFVVCHEAPTEETCRDIGIAYDGDRMVTLDPSPLRVPTLTLVLVRYVAHGYPQELEAVVETLVLS